MFSLFTILLPVLLAAFLQTSPTPSQTVQLPQLPFAHEFRHDGAFVQHPYQSLPLGQQANQIAQILFEGYRLKLRATNPHDWLLGVYQDFLKVKNQIVVDRYQISFGEQFMHQKDGHMMCQIKLKVTDGLPMIPSQPLTFAITVVFRESDQARTIQYQLYN